MSAKNLDSKQRWRSVSVGFRVSPQEAYHIDMLVKTSGLTKQEYIIKRLMCEEIIIVKAWLKLKSREIADYLFCPLFSEKF